MADNKSSESKRNSSNSNCSLSSSFSVLQARDKTIHGISLYKHAMIDIFSLIDCKWHNVKITEISREDKTIQYDGIFDKGIKGAIHYIRFWWKIAKYKSKDTKNNDGYYQNVNTLCAIKYRTQNVFKQNVMIFGYLEIKRCLDGKYRQKYLEIKNQSQFIVCQNHQRSYKHIFKLDLTQITKISSNPSGLDNLSFSISTSKVNNNDIETFYFKCKSFTDFIDWISVLHYLHKYPPVQKKEYNEKIFDGMIEKKGEHNKLYKKRYFVLRNEHLWYSNIEEIYELDKHKKIDLNHVKKICIIDDIDNKYYRFDIIQPHRKWELRVKSKQERKKWKYYIEGQCNKLQEKVF